MNTEHAIAILAQHKPRIPVQLQDGQILIHGVQAHRLPGGVVCGLCFPDLPGANVQWVLDGASPEVAAAAIREAATR